MSIVTPTLNDKDLLEETIRSVSQQTYPRIEHIVVDGGSTDGTVELLERLDVPGLRWRSQVGSGIYEAVNWGLERADGDILAYLNSDDRYFPWAVGSAVDAFRSHSGVGLVFGDVLNLDLAESRGTLLLYPPTRRASFLRSGSLGQPSVFWRREVFEELGGFDTSFRLAADTEYWRRIVHGFRTVKIDEVLALEGDRPERVSRSNTSELEAEIADITSRYNNSSSIVRFLVALLDRVRSSIWHRVLLARFLVADARKDRSSVDGSWSNFLSHGRFEISTSKMMQSAVPHIGRRHIRYVRARSREDLLIGRRPDGTF